MTRKIDKDETVDLAAYEPLNSEFREHAFREWRQDPKGIRMFGLPWKYVLLTIQEENSGTPDIFSS
ncbi:MAG TPA: hypothetical protein VF799_11980 [Geobacteraceae bacterium]